MTRIHIAESENQIEMKCIGHAGYGTPGTDIVCAGISSLVCAWQVKCISLEKDNRIEIEKWNVELGNVDIAIKTNDLAVKEAFSVIRMGLEVIREQYPDYVELCGEK